MKKLFAISKSTRSKSYLFTSISIIVDKDAFAVTNETRQNMDDYIKTFEKSKDYFLKLKRTMEQCRDDYDIKINEVLNVLDHLVRRIEMRIDILETTKKLYDAWPHMIHRTYLKLQLFIFAPISSSRFAGINELGI